MDKIKEWLRLKFVWHLLKYNISICLNIGCSTVSELLSHHWGNQLAWHLPEHMAESLPEATKTLYAPASYRGKEAVPRLLRSSNSLHQPRHG
ncbi:hypothetical protein KCK33_003514 [Salmonella enterica]|nr:hypothetical protein [Salmonella enterica]EGA0603425.1 hypothetical protein [Salmonella enterica]EHD2148895.1 hypothetical protein [Salmonella enterica]EHK2353384.1 hypothetical protein [Salmonella enterica]